MATGNPNVFIMESLTLANEREELFEGKFLSQILNLAGKKPIYYYIRTCAELEEILREFDKSDYRYLHFSCHGSKSSLFTTLEDIPFPKFGYCRAPSS